MTNTNEIETAVTAQFFSGHPRETRRVMVAADGTVSVWDDAAGYYTTCHALSRRVQRRIWREARPTTDAIAAAHGCEIVPGAFGGAVLSVLRRVAGDGAEAERIARARADLAAWGYGAFAA